MIKEWTVSTDNDFLNGNYDNKVFEAAEPVEYVDLDQLEDDIEEGIEEYTLDQYLAAGFKIKRGYYGQKVLYIPKGTKMKYIKTIPTDSNYNWEQVWEVNGIKIYTDCTGFKVYFTESFNARIKNTKPYLEEAYNKCKRLNEDKMNRGLKRKLTEDFGELNDLYVGGYNNAYIVSSSDGYLTDPEGYSIGYDPVVEDIGYAAVFNTTQQAISAIKELINIYKEYPDQYDIQPGEEIVFRIHQLSVVDEMKITV